MGLPDLWCADGLVLCCESEDVGMMTERFVEICKRRGLQIRMKRRAS